MSSNTESTTTFESTLAFTKDADSIIDSCTTCSTNIFTDSTIASTEDPSSTDGSTISSPEWATELIDNGNDKNEGTDGNENKNARENEDRNEDNTTKAGTKVGEKTDIIEKNKATTNPSAIFTDVRNALIPDKKLSENSMFTKVMIREE